MGNNVQFYSTNLFKDAVITVTSNSASASVVLNDDVNNNWCSTNSNDTVTETLTMTLSQSISLDTIILLGNNAKTGTIQYYDGSWNTAKTITSHKEDYLIDLGSVITGVTAIRFNFTTTEVANSEKYCSVFAGCLLNFELITNPRKISPSLSVKTDTQHNKRGLSSISRNGNYIYNVDLDFQNIGTTETLSDFNNILTLFRTRESFYINLTGDTEQDREPYTWHYIKKMAISKDTKIPLASSCHSAGNNIKISMIEVS